MEQKEDNCKSDNTATMQESEKQQADHKRRHVDDSAVTTSSVSTVFEQTLLIVKPDALERGLLPAILDMVQHKGFSWSRIFSIVADRSVLEEHYEEHRLKPFFPKLIERMANKPVVVIVLQGGTGTVEAVRRFVGKTDCSEHGTVRGLLGRGTEGNVVHASDSLESAAREIKLWTQRS